MFERRIAARLGTFRAQGLARALPPITDRSGVRYRLGEREVLGFCSNDYLGLADDPALRDPAHSVPSGAGGSRLICGDLPLHRQVEARLAALVDAPDAVLFPSGFQLNVGVLPLVVEDHDTVISDQLNHASLIDGLRLASPAVTILPHGTHPAPAPHPADAVSWWITESIFSMDGDRISADAVRRFTHRGGSTYVDEAHALGLFSGGRGLMGQASVAPTLLIGTLSKAFGCAGAFVAGSVDACHYIRTRARSFVFSTGTTPVLLARILRSVELVSGPEGDRRRARLWSNAARLADALGNPGPVPSPIFPLLVGDNARAMDLAEALLDAGFHVQPIRPPTVPKQTARLRITVTAAHRPAQIDALATAIRDLFDRRAQPLRIQRGRSEPLPLPEKPAAGRA